jgi:hypothetical protein
MKKSLVGVLNDGTPFVSGVPTNPRANLNVPHGADLDIEVTVITPQGVPVPLAGDGTELLLTVKKRSDQHPPSLVKGSYSVSGNVALFKLQPGDTRRLEAGLYSYDVWLTKDGLRDPVIPLSPLNLQAANAYIPAQPPPEVVTVVEGDTDPTIIDFSPLDISGWTVEMLVGTDPAATLTATIPVGTDGLAYVNTSTIPVGKWAATIRRTNLVPTVKTSDTFILEVVAAIAP